MAKLPKTLAILALIAGLSSGCGELIKKTEETSQLPILPPTSFHKGRIGFIEPAKYEKNGEETFFYCINGSNSSMFGIYSFNNPLIGRDMGARIEALDYDSDGQVDWAEFARENYGKTTENKSIILQRDGSDISKRVFGALDKLAEEMMAILREGDLSSAEIYGRHKEELDFLWSVE